MYILTNMHVGLLEKPQRVQGGIKHLFYSELLHLSAHALGRGGRILLFQSYR